MIKIHFDGACEPFNPDGTASHGWIIREGDRILASGGEIIGSGKGMTNNVGEYTGLIKALEALENLGIGNRKIKIFGDSNLVCSMVAKKWGWNKKKTKWIPHEKAPHLKKLLDRALDLLGHYEFEISWIPREENGEADQLSKDPLIAAGIISAGEDIEECPKCKGTLARRKGAFGEFRGCINYPKCKFTKKL